MEKLKLGKHNHTLTDILKVLIFSIVMLAPFFSILFRCLYVATNKNAKDSYSGESTYQINYKYQSNVVNTESDVIEGNIYTLTVPIFEDSNYGNANYKLICSIDFIKYTITDAFGNYYQEVSFIDEYNNEDLILEYSYSGENLDDMSSFYIYVNRNSMLVAFDDFGLEFTNLVFKLKTLNENTENVNEFIHYTDYNEIESVDINNNGTLDNAFEYSIKQLNESNTFNWVQNTALYTPINNMTIGLGFDNEHNTLALLLTYWTLNTAIYIIFDIVIGIFTKLTHIVQN